MKSVKKIISGVFIFVVVAIVGVLSLVLSPQSLFAHEIEYSQFKIYSNTEIAQGDIADYLDAAYKLVEQSELHDVDYRFDVFISHGTFYNKIDNTVFDSWAVARAVDNNLIIKNPVKLEEGILLNGENYFDLEYVFAHEMIHCLQHNKYGKHKFNPLNHPPMWKMEGYPEYIGRQNTISAEGYDLVHEIGQFLEKTKDKGMYDIIQLSEKQSTPYIYYKGRLMTEYLIDVKQMTYDNILDEGTKEEEVYAEMLEWYENQLKETPVSK